MPSANDELRIRAGLEGDVPAVIELMRVALGEGNIPRTRDFFDWKHRHNPFGESPMWVAESAGRLVGVRLFMRWSWRWGIEQFAAVRAVDTATHPDFQGRGIFKRLTLALVEQVTHDGVALVFNTPNEKSRPGYLKMGWSNTGKAPLWIRPEASARGLARLLKLGGALPPLSATEVAATAERCTQLPAFIAEADAAGLLRTTPGASDAAHYRTTKTRSYLNWRYASCPAVRYAASSADPRRALAIYRVRERRGLRELSVSELLFERTPRGLQAAVATLRAARRAAQADYALVAFERDPVQALALTGAGFFPAPRSGPIMTVRALNQNPRAPDPLRVRSFAASIGDLELF